MLAMTATLHAHNALQSDPHLDNFLWHDGLAWLIDRQAFRIVVSGHTRAGVVSDRANYTDWDLSTDQAQATRRLLTYYAVDSSRFEQLAGYGSTKPMPGLPSSFICGSRSFIDWLAKSI